MQKVGFDFKTRTHTHTHTLLTCIVKKFSSPYLNFSSALKKFFITLYCQSGKYSFAEKLFSVLRVQLGRIPSFSWFLFSSSCFVNFFLFFFFENKNTIRKEILFLNRKLKVRKIFLRNKKKSRKNVI